MTEKSPYPMGLIRLVFSIILINAGRWPQIWTARTTGIYFAIFKSVFPVTAPLYSNLALQPLPVTVQNVP
jgi:hypothetical protein